jgi:hypothetical protein
MCKHCGQVMGQTAVSLGITDKVSHNPQTGLFLGVVQLTEFTRTCAHKILGFGTAYFDIFPSVNFQLYPLSTRPITSSYN